MTNDHAACCSPTRGEAATTTQRLPSPTHGREDAGADRSHNGMVRLDGGSFLMGTDDPGGFPADGDGPVRDVTIRPFLIDRHAGSDERFAAFGRATGYVTEAERF